MRRVAASLLLLCLACTGGGSDVPTEGANLGGAPPSAFGIDAALAEDTARAFLEAYEDPRTLAERHSELVTGPDLRHWVHWAGVQNEQLEILPRGEVAITQLRVVALSPALAEVAVEAVVGFRFRDVDGEPVESVRTYTSPMILIRRDPEGPWSVLDAVRDGRPMAASISPIRPPASGESGPARVEVASVFRFEVRTFVNVRIHNDGPTPMRLDLERSYLVVAGEGLQGLAATGSLLDPIPPRATVEGGLSFGTIPLDAVPEGVVIRVEGVGANDVEIALPPEPFALPPQSNSGGDGSPGA